MCNDELFGYLRWGTSHVGSSMAGRNRHIRYAKTTSQIIFRATCRVQAMVEIVGYMSCILHVYTVNDFVSYWIGFYPIRLDGSLVIVYGLYLSLVIYETV